MKKLLTYVLWGNDVRYWGNIPYLLIANSLLYPEFVMRFYVHKDSIENPFFIFLLKLSELLDSVELKIVNIPYQGTQLTTLRVKPLWEDVEYLFCRDVDYALSSIERKSVDYFLSQSDCIIHDIRGYCTHNIIPAGLCGFNVKKLFEKIKIIAPTFEDYIKWGIKNVSHCKTWKWECEQLLVKHFLLYIDIEESILDCPQGDARLELKDMPRAKMCLPSEYCNLKLNCNEDILKFLDSLCSTFTKWNKFRPFAGRAWTCSYEHLKKLLSLANNKVSKTVEKILVDDFCGESSWWIKNSK